jgi:hypothetical protein
VAEILKWTCEELLRVDDVVIEGRLAEPIERWTHHVSVRHTYVSIHEAYVSRHAHRSVRHTHARVRHTHASFARVSRNLVLGFGSAPKVC